MEPQFHRWILKAGPGRMSKSNSNSNSNPKTAKKGKSKPSPVHVSLDKPTRLIEGGPGKRGGAPLIRIFFLQNEWVLCVGSKRLPRTRLDLQNSSTFESIRRIEVRQWRVRSTGLSQHTLEAIRSKQLVRSRTLAMLKQALPDS